MGLELTTEQWVLGMIGALLVGLTKGGVPGIGNLTAGIFAVIFASKASVGILLPILISGDIVAILIYRKHANWAMVVRLLPWTFVGLILGWFFLGRIDDRGIQVLIGLILILMSGAQWLRHGLTGEGGRLASWDIRRSRIFRWTSGVLAGATTMLANAAGPVASLYFISMGLPKYAFIGTAAWFFFIVNVIKVPFMVEREILHFESLSISLAFIPLTVIGALIAPRIVHWIRQDVFEGLIWFFIVVAGIGLLVKPDWPKYLFFYVS